MRLEHMCNEPGHIINRSRIERGLICFLPEKERERVRCEISSKNPYKTNIESLKFYMRKDFLKYKYKLAMISLEDHFPEVYNALTSLGFPKPYEPRYGTSFHDD